ncbi:MAG: hypothetical protein AAF597_03820, partial [Bacteroidota bacterium]
MRFTINRGFPTLLFVLILCTCTSAMLGINQTGGLRAQQTPQFPIPVNDIVTDRDAVQNTPLQPAPLRAADIMWQKRVWRVIDVREKINHTFSYPPRPLVSILLDAAEEQRIQLYSTVDDKFSTPLTETERLQSAGMPDTV